MNEDERLFQLVAHGRCPNCAETSGLEATGGLLQCTSCQAKFAHDKFGVRRIDNGTSEAKELSP